MLPANMTSFAGELSEEQPGLLAGWICRKEWTPTKHNARNLSCRIFSCVNGLESVDTARCDRVQTAPIPGITNRLCQPRSPGHPRIKSVRKHGTSDGNAQPTFSVCPIRVANVTRYVQHTQQRHVYLVRDSRFDRRGLRDFSHSVHQSCLNSQHLVMHGWALGYGHPCLPT